VAVVVAAIGFAVAVVAIGSVVAIVDNCHNHRVVESAGTAVAVPVEEEVAGYSQTESEGMVRTDIVVRWQIDTAVE
jgi:hypothetical protein